MAIQSNAVVLSRLLVGSERQANGCLYFRPNSRKDGYGNMYANGKQQGAHRWAHELQIGLIPDGNMIDHVCHDPRVCAGGISCPHRQCIEPKHLSLASIAENSSKERSHSYWADQTHCIHGHEFTEKNTYQAKTGTRACKQCKRDWAARNKARNLERTNEWRRRNRDQVNERRRARRAGA